MTMTAPAPTTDRVATPRRYLMVRPEHFEVAYAINPWMHEGIAVDTSRAIAQWEELVEVHRSLGHTVELLDPVPGLPDMVFAANGCLSTPRATIAARFAYPQRAPEAAAHAAWLTAAGLGPVLATRHTHEGEGDLLVVGNRILAGTGFRTAAAAHAEIAELTGMEVVGLELVDERYYHLDTCLAVLDDDTIAWYPPAFSAASRATIERLHPDAVVASAATAEVLGLNVVSDGRHVVLPAGATEFADQLRAAGFVPVPVDLSELLKGGGSVKCCTSELRRTR